MSALITGLFGIAVGTLFMALLSAAMFILGQNGVL